MSQFSTRTSHSCHSAPLVALCILLNQHVHGVPCEGGEMGNKQKHLAYSISEAGHDDLGGSLQDTL